MSHELGLGLLILPIAVGVVIYGYIALTGRWITWPIRPRNIPMTAHHRRLTGSGMLLFFIALALLDSNLFPQLSGFPIALLLSLPLMIAGLLMVKAGWKMPPQPSGHYRLEGWPPATKVD